MKLDVPTLIVTLTLTTFSCGIALAAASRLHLPVRGIGLWSGALLLGSLGLALMLSRTVAGPVVGIVLANTVIMAGRVLLWLGARRMAGRPLHPLQMVVPVALTAIGVGMFMGDDGLAARLAIVSFITTVLLLLTMRELMQQTTPATITRYGLTLLCTAQALFYAYRGVMAVIDPPLHTAPFPEGLMGTLTILVSFVWVTVGALGLVVLTSEVLHAELKRQAMRDPLTDAFNRRAFTDLAERELASARRGRKMPAFLVLDLDHFKQLNDRHGHDAGDRVLQAFVETTSACFAARTCWPASVARNSCSCCPTARPPRPRRRPSASARRWRP